MALSSGSLDPRGLLRFALLLGLLGSACGPAGGLVGGPCRDDRDCAERCLSGKDYPDGMCALACRDDRDCPRDSWCVDRSGGVCLLECFDHRDCRPGYACDDKSRKGGPGKVDVCVGD